MTNPLLNSVVEPVVLDENKITINSFLKQSYGHAKKGLEDGVNLIHDGVSYIKEEFSSFYERTGEYLNKMVLPVNNFLKDLTQIESELQQEISKDSSSQLICLNGVMVPVEQVLNRPMEENY
jgi:hypothetical protein